MDDFIVTPKKGARQSSPSSPQSFQTPDEVAAKETNTNGELGAPNTAAGSSAGKAPKQRWYKRLSKKQWIIIGIVGALLLAGGGFGIWKLTHHKKPVTPKPAAQKTTTVTPPKSDAVASNLTGLPVLPAVNERSVTAVMIENSPDARPQSGLNSAGVVFEAVAEGGITRFLTLFQDTSPDYIGPVRSVRPYYLQWLKGFDAPVAHVGGSPEALADIKAWGVKDLDQFANGSYYHRISSRYAPHNVYTSMYNLNTLESKKGFGKSNYTSLARKAEQPSAAPTARAIDLAISSTLYNSHFDYDAAKNAYIRSEGGKQHLVVDSAGNQAIIEPKVVIALVMHQGIESDDLHTSYNTIGTGQAFIFQDGIETTATWHKASAEAQFSFTDANGKALALNAGQTWFTAMGDAKNVSFKP